MHEPEPRTVRAAAEGDLAAFEELVHAYQAHIWRFLRHLVNDPALAEDLTQETFLRVYRGLGSFRFESKFSTWVFRIARNAGVDALRSRQRRDRLARLLPGGRPLGDASLRVEIDAGMASLTHILREAFVLIEVFGFTYSEAADALGVPEGTVKSRVHRAREQLVAWMRAGDAEERTGAV